jgi:hypothetical protein
MVAMQYDFEGFKCCLRSIFRSTAFSDVVIGCFQSSDDLVACCTKISEPVHSAGKKNTTGLTFFSYRGVVFYAPDDRVLRTFQSSDDLPANA